VLVAAVAVQAALPLVDLAGGHLLLNQPGPSLPLSVLLMTVVGVVLLSGRERRPATVEAGPDRRQGP
jgi:hypothetical protein